MPSSIAQARILPLTRIVKRVGYVPLLDPSLEPPAHTGNLLGLQRPTPEEVAARVRLEDIQLRLNVLPHIRNDVVGPTLHVHGGVRGRIEVADVDGNLVVVQARHGVAAGAGVLDVLRLGHLLLAGAGELGHALCDGEKTLGRGAGGGERLHVPRGGGGVGHDNLEVGVLGGGGFHGGEGLFGEGVEGVGIGLGEGDGRGEDLDGGYCARVLSGAVFFGYGGEDGEGMRDGLVGGDFGEGCR